MSTIKITNLTSSGAIVGNVVLPVVGNVAGTLTTLKATVDQLKTFVTAGTEANITLANTIQSAQITSANVGIIGYIGLANTALRDYVDGQITAGNAGVTAANIGMKGYVDSVANQSIYGNVNVKAYTESMGFQNFSNVNVAAYVTTANSAIVGYIDFANTIQSQQITAANIGIIGYIGLGNTTTRAYIDGQITAANAGVTAANVGMLGLVNLVIDAVTIANSIQANLIANLGAIDLTTLNAAIGVHTTQIATLDANAAVQAGNIAELFANAAAQAVLISSLGNTQQIEANITALQSNAATQSDLIIGINANVSAANIGIKGYVDSRITLANTGITTANTGMLGYVDSRITVANAGVTAANVGIIGYVDLANTIQSAQVNAANLAITAANLGLKGYVDQANTIQSAQIDTLTANSAVQGADINSLLSSVGSLTGQISQANVGMQGYVDLANTIQSAQVNAANLATIAANLGMKGYVDSVAGQSIYGNANVASYLPTYNGVVTASNVAVNGNVTAQYFLGNGAFLTGIVGGAGNYGNIDVKAFLETDAGPGDGFQRVIEGYYANIILGDSTKLFSFGNSSKSYFGHDGFANININYVRADNSDVRIATNNAAYAWIFSNAGNLTLPAGGRILESTYLSADSIRLKPNGGTSTQYLEIAPTAVDGNHVHLMTGSGTELFLGDDNHYVKLANTGEVVINSNDGIGNTAQWTFGQDGNLTLPIIAAINYANGVSILTGLGGGSYSNVQVATYLPTYSGDIANITLGASGEIAFNQSSYIIETDIVDGNLTPTGYHSLSLNSTPNGILVLNALDSNSAVSSSVTVANTSAQINVNNQIWTFDDGGNLTLPVTGQIQGNVDFTMANVTHWTSNVYTVSDALNQLAERIWNIENP